MDDRRAAYIANEDGDTVTVLLNQGFGDSKRVNLRLANVWAPEEDQEGYADVDQFVFEWFMKHVLGLERERFPFHVFFVPTRNETYRMTYNRYVATVMTRDGKHCLNEEVMAYILEKGYEGGTGWKEVVRPAGAE